VFGIEEAAGSCEVCPGFDLGLEAPRIFFRARSSATGNLRLHQAQNSGAARVLPAQSGPGFKRCHNLTACKPCAARALGRSASFATSSPSPAIPPSVGDYPRNHGVYEVDSVGLVKVLHRLTGHRLGRKTLGGATNFAIGVAVNLLRRISTEKWRFQAKIEAGHTSHDPALFDPNTGTPS